MPTTMPQTIVKTREKFPGIQHHVTSVLVCEDCWHYITTHSLDLYKDAHIPVDDEPTDEALEKLAAIKKIDLEEFFPDPWSQKVIGFVRCFSCGYDAGKSHTIARLQFYRHRLGDFTKPKEVVSTW